MRRRPRALDLFCGAGGVSMGLYRAGFDVVGVDMVHQPRYPAFFHHLQFVQADALSYPLEGFDFIWASPVCKRFSALRFYGTNRNRPLETWPDQIAPMRARLEDSGALWCIENVKGAPLHTDKFLCGQMFGLPLIRHRLMETNFEWKPPKHKCAKKGCTKRKEVFTIVGNGGGANAKSESNRRQEWRLADGRRALGITWMVRAELSQAVPPAYAEYVGRCALKVLRSDYPIPRSPDLPISFQPEVSA
jgi:DNA (cytosine-5)-methyltransferase 1